MKFLEAYTESYLTLQQRVPEEFSATESEHQWHNVPHVFSINVTNDSIPVLMEKVESLLRGLVEREDVEYRVVLDVTSRKSWVIR